jgi:membrane protein DedA with SNARE-associated domain
MVVWSAGLSLVGYFVGNNVETIDRIISRIGLAGLAVAVLVVGFWIWRHRRAADDPAAP